MTHCAAAAAADDDDDDDDDDAVVLAPVSCEPCFPCFFFVHRLCCCGRLYAITASPAAATYCPSQGRGRAGFACDERMLQPRHVENAMKTVPASVRGLHLFASKKHT